MQYNVTLTQEPKNYISMHVCNNSLFFPGPDLEKWFADYGQHLAAIVPDWADKFTVQLTVDTSDIVTALVVRESIAEGDFTCEIYAKLVRMFM